MRREAVVMTVVLMGACAQGEGGPTVEDTPGGNPDAPTFVGRLGQDTVFLEHFQRQGNRVEGTVVARQPYTHTIAYTADMGDDGFVRTLHSEMATPPENAEGPPPASWTITVDQGTATVVVDRPDGSDTTLMEVNPGAIPTLGRAPQGMFSMDQATRQAAAAAADTYSLQLIDPRRAQPVANALAPVGEGTLSFDFFGNPFLVHVDDRGRVRSTSGARTTMKVETTPVTTPVDLAARAAAWADADARGEGMGVASPGANVRAEVDGATLEVVYSRPAKRGRDIWGGLVPFGEVWRTGANAATEFITDHDLEMGGKLIPAGSYTLWSVFRPEGQELIVNAQTGQWGTQYDEAQDVARIPMEHSDAPEMSERFTVGVDDTEDGGVLHLTWDRTRWSVSFVVR